MYRCLSLVTSDNRDIFYSFPVNKFVSNLRFHLDAIGVEKLHRSQKLCGCCQAPMDDSSRCRTTDCKHRDARVPPDDIVEIISFDIIEQLRLLINQHMNILRRYQDEARDRRTDDKQDIVCGDVYQALLTPHKHFFVSMMIHCDGIPLYKSKNLNAWPMLGAVLELPPLARTRADNILLLGIWIGRKKPNFNTILQVLSPQLFTLKNEGLRIGEEDPIRVIFPMLMGDMPALSSMVNFVEPNAFYACMFCDVKGVYHHRGHCIIYPLDDRSRLRTTQSFDECARLASAMQPRTDRERTKGAKGTSMFSQILDVPLPHAIVIDTMHTAFLCHSKKLLIHLRSTISKENLAKISEKLHSMKYIHDILRRPRSIDNIGKWKASEVRTFILYVGLPVLCEFLAEDESGQLSLYVVILRLLHDYWNDDQNLHRSISNLLDCYIADLAEKIESSNYPPNLLTISTHTHLHLPLQCKKFGRLHWLSNFVFESFLGFLKGFVKGSRGASDQIAFAFISNFVVPKKQSKPSRTFGHFPIDGQTYGSNIVKLSEEEPLFAFLNRKQLVTANTIFFSRVHFATTTYHSFLYERKGSTCSYLVSYEKQNILHYGYILAFIQTSGSCSAIIQQLIPVDDSLTSCFPSYNRVDTIKGWLDDMYIVFKRVPPCLSSFDNCHVCAVSCLRSRCFAVPFRDDLMVVTKYSSAYEHN